MSQVIQLHQRKSNQQSFAITTAVLVALLLMLLFMKLQHPIIEDAISGVMIDFGDNKEGLGDDNTREAGGPSASPEKTVKSSPVPTPPTPTPKPVKASSPVRTPPNNTVTAEDPNAVAIAKIKKEEEKKRQQEIIEQQRIAEAVRKAEAERAARAAEEKRIRDQTASVFTKGKNGSGSGTGNSTGNGPGNGQGNGKPGGNAGASNGTPGGDPNGSGTGAYGRGPGAGDGDLHVTGRRWRDRVQPFNAQNKEGKVVVQIKVDKEGNIIYARGGVAGSTTTDSYLVKQAEDAARRSKLTVSTGTAEEQIGTIVYNFTLSQ